jgi:hypothetical protein
MVGSARVAEPLVFVDFSIRLDCVVDSRTPMIRQ